MSRYCFTLRVAPEHLDEYRRRHARVWPDMITALAASGWRNYSLFLRPDGLLVGYVESDVAFDVLQDRMALTEVNARWQAEMTPFFDGLVGTPDTGLQLIPEVFHLEDQLDGGSKAR
ncbi:L-rhamnose mutarotase [Microbacterium sp. NPDC091313]